MKLLLCLDCQDVFKIHPEKVTTCKCGDTKGRYLDDGINAIYSGSQAMPLGFRNSTLVYALKNQPLRGLGTDFSAFVIPIECETFVKVDPSHTMLEDSSTANSSA